MIRKPSDNQCSGSQNHLQDQEARMSLSKFKAMLIVFFDIQGTVMAEWLPSGQKVNQLYYIKFLTKLRESVRGKRPELWRNFWIWHRDNAPANNALSVEQFLANKNITVLEHPPYSPELAPCDFYLFAKIKSVLKGIHFLSVENVKAKTAEILNILREHDLRNCFESWQHRMQLCVNLEGNYFEGDRSWFSEFLK
jgi:transposase